jgi:hypothetical protein
MTYTYASLKYGKLYVTNKERFRNSYLCLRDKEPVKVRITIEDVVNEAKVYILGEIIKDRLHYDLSELNEKLKQITGESVRIFVEKVGYNGTISQRIYYNNVILFEFIWGYYDINHEFVPKEIANYILKGKYMPSGKDISDLDYNEFDLFISKCRGFINSFFGREVPLPERHDEELFQF